VNIEKEFLHYIVKSKKALNEALARNIRSSFFSNPDLGKLLEVAFKYYRKYNRILSSGVLLKILDKSIEITEKEKKSILMLFDELVDLKPEGPYEFLIDELVENERGKQVNDLLLKTVDVSEKGKVEESLKVIKKGLMDIEGLGKSIVAGGRLKDSIDERKRMYLERKADPQAVQGILTPFKTFNYLTNGVMPGDLCLVISSTSEGKSTFLLNVGYYAYINGYNVIYIQIEMPKERLENRLDALDSNLESRKIFLGQLDREEEKKYFEVLKDQRKRTGIFYTCDVPSDCTTDVVSSQIEELKMQFDPDLVIVDYYDIMSPTYSERAGSSGWETRKNMAVNLKSVARKHRVGLWTAAQVDTPGQKSEGKSYELYHVALTKYLPAQTDITLSLKSVDPEVTVATGLGELIATLKKNRNNPKGQFTVFAEFSKFFMEEVGGIRKI